MKPFVGRKTELHQLQEFRKRKIAGLVVVCGRRRVGKSTLIEQFAQESRFLEFYGLPPDQGLTVQGQLNHFSKLLGSYFQLPAVKLENWHQALSLLAQLTREGQFTILLDEISWMAGSDKAFPGVLKGVWDTQLKKNPRLILILCGSVTSWIEDNILYGTGFMGRVSLTIHLKEMPLSDANLFWGNRSISAHEKFKVLCVTGGIPRYLEEMKPEETAEHNIKRLCFTKGGVLVDEFDKIFRDIFLKQADDYKKIVQALVHGSCDLGELCKKLGILPTGGLSRKLHVLEQAGFIVRHYVWEKGTKKSKLSKFRLSDNYLRFYLKYIDPKRSLVEQGLYPDLFLEDLPDWETVMGLQFENLVLNNLLPIQKLLHIPPSSLLSVAPYFRRATKRQKGCQIDLLIQTRHSLYPCEIKFGKKITSNVLQEMAEKIELLPSPQGMSIRPVLIYQGELAPAIKEADLFTHLIPFEQLLQVC